jgi:cyclopropane fatty-acyl-phospholipid synthase-like methyltransferase
LITIALIGAFVYARSSLNQGDRRVSFDLQDYRHLKGRFDRIVSVGMFEHVGAASYATSGCGRGSVPV